MISDGDPTGANVAVLATLPPITEAIELPNVVALVYSIRYRLVSPGLSESKVRPLMVPDRKLKPALSPGAIPRSTSVGVKPPEITPPVGVDPLSRYPASTRKLL